MQRTEQNQTAPAGQNSEPTETLSEGAQELAAQIAKLPEPQRSQLAAKIAAEKGYPPKAWADACHIGEQELPTFEEHQRARLLARVKRSPPSLAGSFYYLEQGQEVGVLRTFGRIAVCYAGKREERRIPREDLFEVNLADLLPLRPYLMTYAQDVPYFADFCQWAESEDAALRIANRLLQDGTLPFILDGKAKPSWDNASNERVFANDAETMDPADETLDVLALTAEITLPAAWNVTPTMGEPNRLETSIDLTLALLRAQLAVWTAKDALEKHEGSDLEFDTLDDICTPLGDPETITRAEAEQALAVLKGGN